MVRQAANQDWQVPDDVKRLAIVELFDNVDFDHIDFDHIDKVDERLFIGIARAIIATAAANLRRERQRRSRKSRSAR